MSEKFDVDAANQCYDKRMGEFAPDQALMIAAQCWCDPRTSHITMDSALAEVFAEKLSEYIGALQWCGGSADFAPGGKAREGWEKLCLPLLTHCQPEIDGEQRP